MSSEQFQAQVAAARSYEALFVPALFQQWTALMIKAADIRLGHQVLDVACGTGILARDVHKQVGPAGHVAGLDITPGMVAVARQLAESIEWHEGSAEALPFPDASVDRVVCQFGLMFFADKTVGLREMLRVLRPGGRLAVAVWDSLANNLAFAAEVALLARLAGETAADALRAPFGLGDEAALAQLARAAGVADSQIKTYQGQAQFPSVRSLVEADLRGWLPVMGVNLSEELIEAILAEAAIALGAYIDAEGQVNFPISAHILSGQKL